MVKGHAWVMIVIIGGGIQGLAAGWLLARDGLEVTVFERGRCGCGASGAAAGMLAAHIEAPAGREALRPFLVESGVLWRSFAARLEEDSGLGVDYRAAGALLVAFDRDACERLESLYSASAHAAHAMSWLRAEALYEREPALAPGAVGALASPDDHSVDNRKVVAALAVAFKRRGGRLFEHCAVDRVEVSQGRVKGVVCGDAFTPADVVVVAAGAWSRRLGGLPPSALLPVRPLKGQMLAVDCRGAPLLNCAVWGDDCYLTPRSDGRLLVGATVEEKGFDTTVTAGALYDLLRRAWRMLPAIEELAVVETWAGLRPASRDSLPVVGPAPEGWGTRGLVYATGHGRNGILLAPVTAEAVRLWLAKGRAHDIFTSMTPGRFDGLAMGTRVRRGACDGGAQAAP